MIHSIQAYKWTHGYGMFNNGASLNGIDTCSMTNFGKFDFDSQFLNEVEARSIANRPYINEFINYIAKEENMSPYVAHANAYLLVIFRQSQLQKIL